MESVKCEIKSDDMVPLGMWIKIHNPSDLRARIKLRYLNPIYNQNFKLKISYVVLRNAIFSLPILDG